MIEITENAKKEITRLLANQPEKHAIRFFVKGGGCAGMSYGMNFESEQKENDRTFEVGDFEVLMDPKSYMFLKGIKIDFKESLMGRGFVFENPNATGACGCGTSFSI